MANRVLNVGPWLLRLIAWDGLLPVFVVSVSFGVKLIFPDERIAIELTALILPSVACLVRICIGGRQIATNLCGSAMRTLQFVTFVLGILLLGSMESFMVLTHVMPPQALFASKTDCLIWGMLFSIYFVLMAIAMYPGSRTHTEPIY